MSRAPVQLAVFDPAAAFPVVASFLRALWLTLFSLRVLLLPVHSVHDVHLALLAVPRHKDGAFVPVCG